MERIIHQRSSHELKSISNSVLAYLPKADLREEKSLARAIPLLIPAQEPHALNMRVILKSTEMTLTPIKFLVIRSSCRILNRNFMNLESHLRLPFQSKWPWCP